MIYCPDCDEPVVLCDCRFGGGHVAIEPEPASVDTVITERINGNTACGRVHLSNGLVVLWTAVVYLPMQMVVELFAADDRCSDSYIARHQELLVSAITVEVIAKV